MKFKFALLGLGLFLCSTAHALPAIVEGQLILRLANNLALEEIKSMPGVSEVEALAPDLNIYLVKFEGTVMSARASLKNFKTRTDVVWSQLDHLLSPRLAPNDKDFATQWNLYNSTNRADVRAQEAWEITTGGTDRNGNDIVVAIIDGAVDVDHSELKENIWTNEYEVPDNNIDDDENGYIDDVHGWAVTAGPALRQADDHATHIAGIIGARANNSNMVAGINWNVKIMTVNRSNNTSLAIKGYGYILKNKTLWIETKGSRGANVVSTNSSFGVDYGNCTLGSYPAWNDMYNEMGKVGILSAAATANLNIDIDAKGDIPTSCDSPYLISVTNTTSEDKKNDLSGFGKKHIDLGAPGTKIVSTISQERTAALSGTSMATPHVAAAVALVHSAASFDLEKLMIDNPGAGALKIKEIILNSVDQIEDLKNRSVSGGRLNLARAVQMATDYRQSRN